MENNKRSFQQFASIYIKDFSWPHTVQVAKKPFQPPVRTGLRLYCSEPDKRICKQQSSCHGDYKTPNTKLTKIRKKSDCNLMKRHEILEYPPINTYKTYMPDKERLISTQQLAFSSAKFSYENLLDRAANDPEYPVTTKMCRRYRKRYWDPIPFKKNVTKEPLLYDVF